MCRNQRHIVPFADRFISLPYKRSYVDGFFHFYTYLGTKNADAAFFFANLS